MLHWVRSLPDAPLKTLGQVLVEQRKRESDSLMELTAVDSLLFS
jgi:hypothetical protein